MSALACSHSKKAEGPHPVSGDSITRSGFPYIHHIRNEGPRPQPGDYVSFHMIMLSGDTLMFDSDGQAETPMIQIPLASEQPASPSPIIEGLQLMAVGDSITLENRPDPDSPPIVYRMALKKILGKDQYQQEQSYRQKRSDTEGRAGLREKEEAFRLETRFRWKQYRTGQIEGILMQTPSGLRVLPIEDGLGEKPMPGQWVRIHYYGILMDGSEFVNTPAQGREFTFQIGEGQIPVGIEEGVRRLGKGGRSVLFIPWPLGFGEEGRNNIPAQADLVVFLELVDILK